MEVKYVSTVCSKNMFDYLFSKSENKPQQQAQKFHYLLSKGLTKNGFNLSFITRPPITDKKAINKFYRAIAKKEKYKYKYLNIYKIPLVKELMLFTITFLSLVHWFFKYRKEEKIIFVDILSISLTFSSIIFSKIFRVKAVALVTDLPKDMSNFNGNKNYVNRLKKKIIRLATYFYTSKFDYYILLTKQMDKIVNPKNSPSLLIEGLADINMRNKENSLKNKYETRVILYAGSLDEKNGIIKLVKAFSKIDNLKINLWIFGQGDSSKIIKDYSLKDERIKYLGVVKNEIVLEQQIKATLLINPRPSNQTFTQYSFPSKNLEYMASGTPLLSTKLKGIPEEYSDYIYFFEDESIQGMSKTISSIIEKSDVELKKMGDKAKKFILEHKNYLIQTKKIIKFLQINNIDKR